MRVFKIQNIVTGEFKSSGIEGFDKNGKIWHNSRNLAIHISGYDGHLPKNCVVVEYELVEKRRIPLEDWHSKI